MGYRYRKSINLGGGFRINLSKSGVGYSWGTKGYRVTKTAKGTTRTTASIPGTGFSYVHETRKPTAPGTGRGVSPVPQSAPAPDNNHYDTQNIVNNVASAMVSEGLEAILATASRTLKLNRLSIVGCLTSLIIGCVFPFFFILALLFAMLFICVHTKGMIDLDYEIETDQQSVVDKQINPMIKITACAKVWRIMQTSKVINRKYTAGASSTVNRMRCAATTKPPFPFRTNAKVASFKSKKETLLFLPDKLFIIQGVKIGALSYCDITSHAHTTRFIECEAVPKDAQVIDHTWKYVNKSGGPDKRFKDNRQLPVCLYGELELTSTSGLNTVIMFSNSDLR